MSACTITASTTSARTATCAADDRGTRSRRILRALLLRAGPQGERRRAGRALDPAPGRWFHLLLQRPPFAVRRTPCGRCARSPWPTAWDTSSWERTTERSSLLERLLQHAGATARYSIYYGEGRDSYDVPGRVAHESIFNVNDGAYRCPNSQQGYSPFSTWTRGLAWPSSGSPKSWSTWRPCGDAELESRWGADEAARSLLRRAAEVTSEFYIANTRERRHPVLGHRGARGSRTWATGGKGPRIPTTTHEPVDSSAAAIAARASCGSGTGCARAERMRGIGVLRGAGLTVAGTVLEEPYLSRDARHQGLILHSVYHRPNGWDYRPDGPQGALRGVQHVGRLPSSGGRAVRPATEWRGSAAVSAFLRYRA